MRRPTLPAKVYYNRKVCHDTDHKTGWTHPRDRCVVLARLNGYSLESFELDSWRNGKTKCLGCGKIINYINGHSQ